MIPESCLCNIKFSARYEFLTGRKVPQTSSGSPVSMRQRLMRAGGRWRSCPGGESARANLYSAAGLRPWILSRRALSQAVAKSIGFRRRYQHENLCLQLVQMVGVVGIEPTTPSMSPKCSPAELHTHPKPRIHHFCAGASIASGRLRPVFSPTLPDAPESEAQAA